MPYIFNDIIAPRVPKQINLFLGFVQIRNINISPLKINTTRAKFTIDEGKRGIMMNWAELIDFNIHFEPLAIMIWPIQYGFRVDIDLKNVILDNGLSLDANTRTGSPIVNFFNTQLLLGSSSINFSGDLAIFIIGWLSNILVTPVQILIN